MAHVDIQYNKLVSRVLNHGFTYQDRSRANIDMLQIPSHTLEIDMLQGFPLITSKRIYWKLVAHELIWMLSGATDIDYLIQNNVRIWNKDAVNYSGFSEVGRIYGAQWRSWTSFDSEGNPNNLDQIKKLIEGLKIDLHSRRHLVTAWNPAELNDMALPPCHWAFEILPTGQSSFALKWHQRSCDLFLGIPFDIALYAFMGKLIEKQTNLTFTHLIGQLSNVHFYAPHIELAKQQTGRKISMDYTWLDIADKATLDNLHIDDFKINNYSPHPGIKAEMYAKVPN